MDQQILYFVRELSVNFIQNQFVLHTKKEPLEDSISSWLYTGCGGINKKNTKFLA